MYQRQKSLPNKEDEDDQQLEISTVSSCDNAQGTGDEVFENTHCIEVTKLKSIDNSKLKNLNGLTGKLTQDCLLNVLYVAVSFTVSFCLVDAKEALMMGHFVIALLVGKHIKEKKLVLRIESLVLREREIELMEANAVALIV